MPWIHIEDLVQLLVFAAANDTMEGPVNAAAPQPVRNADFTHALAHAVHRPAILPVPEFALRLVLGEAAAYTTASQRVLPQATLQAGFAFQHPDLSHALANLLA
jgi:NAD dependent epimerase/dehydratase family enzyme